MQKLCLADVGVWQKIAYFSIRTHRWLVLRFAPSKYCTVLPYSLSIGQSFVCMFVHVKRLQTLLSSAEDLLAEDVRKQPPLQGFLTEMKNKGK